MTKDEFILKRLWPEQWHEYHQENGLVYRCSCGQPGPIKWMKEHSETLNNPDLASAEGFFVLLKGMQAHEKWEEFKVEHGSISKYGHDLDLLLEDIIDPIKFRDIVFIWLGGGE